MNKSTYADAQCNIKALILSSTDMYSTMDSVSVLLYYNGLSLCHTFGLNTDPCYNVNKERIIWALTEPHDHLFSTSLMINVGILVPTVHVNIGSLSLCSKKPKE